VKHRIAVAIASLVLGLSGLVATQASAASRTVSASGGSVTFTAAVRGAATCQWSARPSIPGFATTVRCKTGNVSRSARFRANTSTSVKTYTITLTVRGHRTAFDHWKVTQAGKTTTTLPPVRSLVLWSSSGQGSMSGPKFTVPAQATSWTENWSYDCSSFGTSGNFITSIAGYGASRGTTDSGANQLGTSGSGVNHYYDTGTFSIQVNSECSWTESIVAVGPIPSAVTASPLPSSANVLWSMSGQGALSGPQFTVSSSASGWIEHWSYDCTSFGTSGNFITSITGYGGASGTTDMGANELGMSGSGSNYYYGTGTFSIQVNSECNWTETVGSY